MVAGTKIVKDKQTGSMLTTSDVARIFDVHSSTVRRWSNQGILAAYRSSPRAIRKFRREDVAALFLQRAIQRHLEE